VSGQKVWTSYAQHARWAILLARTDASARKHRGISYFIVDMQAAGIEIRPLRQMSGASEFNEVFLDNVRVPRANLIGKPNEGWQLTQVTLAHERGTNYAIKEQVLARIGVDELIEQIRSRGRSAEAPLRQRLAQLYVETEIMRFMNLAMLTRLGPRRDAGRGDVGRQDVLGRPVASDRRPRDRGPGRPRNAAPRLAARGRGRSLRAAPAVLARGDDRGRHERDPAQHHRAAHARYAARRLKRGTRSPSFTRPSRVKLPPLCAGQCPAGEFGGRRCSPAREACERAAVGVLTANATCRRPSFAAG
jgi:alkylation response protein AidB-like acyl-CoA dehydrogenase